MITVLVLTLLMSPSAARAGDRAIQARWTELHKLVAGRSVAIVLDGGARVEGRALAVWQDALAVLVARTSDPGRFRGEVRIARSSLSTLRVCGHGWKWQVIGPVAGMFGFAAAGYRIGNAIDPKGFIISDGAANGLVAGAAAGIAAGYIAGRIADRRSTVIEILGE